MGIFEVRLNAFFIMTWQQAFGGHGVEYGGLKENGPKGSGTIRSCGFFEVNVTLFEEVCHCGHEL